MTITRDYSTMLQRLYRPKLLLHEYERRSYIYNKIPKKSDWNGCEYKFGFEQGEQSSFSVNELLDQAVIGQEIPLEGTISGPTRFRGALKFREEDLAEHEGKKQSYLPSLLRQTSRFIERSAEITSSLILTGQKLCDFATDGQVGGTFTVTEMNFMRLRVGMYIEVDDGNSSAAQGYISQLDKDTLTVYVRDARDGGGSVVDLSGYTVAQSAAVYLKGGSAVSQESLASVLLLGSHARGSASIYGQTKAGKPHLEAHNIDGSAFTAAKFHEQILDSITEAQIRGSTANTLLMSPYKKNALLKLIDTKTKYNIIRKGDKVPLFAGEVMVEGPDGDFMVKGLKECPEDLVFGLDWSSMRLMSNGMIEVMKDVGDGNPWYRTRTTSGYYIISDLACNFAVEVHTPAANFMIYDVASAVR